MRGAVRFYKKLGFKSADPRATEPFLKRWGGGMELSREGAMALSQRQSSKELIKKPNTKIPAWSDGKPTSFTSVSEGDKEDSASKYMQSLIVPKTDANNGRFGADLILGLLAAKKRRLNP